MKRTEIRNRELDETTGPGRRRFLEQALASGVVLLGTNLRSLAGTPATGGESSNMKNALPTQAVGMTRGAVEFLDSLTGAQRSKATFSFEDEQRFDWHYIPRPRKGIPLKELNPAQRGLARALLGEALSDHGLAKAETIMSVETILREIENGAGPTRDPELYFFTIFGKPAADAAWGWRVEGHHLSLNFSVVGGHVASTPAFFGSNPAEVRHGARKGLRPLAAEEDTARVLLESLDGAQRGHAVVSGTAPADMISRNVRKAALLNPPGIRASTLSGKQSELLMRLIRVYTGGMREELASARMDRVDSGGFGNIAFAWAGGLERGGPHYYRVQGPAFLIEYDNTQNEANHIHTVWRDFDGDFGLDLLAEHHKSAHR